MPVGTAAMDLPGVPARLWPLLGACASVSGLRLALVGGAVRDWLLHRLHCHPWRGLVDLDLVIEVDHSRVEEGGKAAPAWQLVAALAALSGQVELSNVRPHGRYGTVELELTLLADPGVAAAVLLVDVASARQEQYPIPGENPVVRFGHLEDDLARRDVTINAMAVRLESDELLDPYGGQADLAARQLRFLHDASLRDDPTRLIRAARYAARLQFSLDEGSRRQAAATMAVWPWPWRPGDSPDSAPPALGTRLRREMELLLERENWRVALRHLQDWGGLLLLDPLLQADSNWLRRLRWAERVGLPLLPALLAGAADPLALAERLQLPHRQHRLLAQHIELRRRLAIAACWPGGGSLVGGPALPSCWCALLEAPGVSADAVALALVSGDLPRRPLLRWWLRWRHLRSDVTAAELIAEGVLPGPLLGQRLAQRRSERLDRERR